MAVAAARHVGGNDDLPPPAEDQRRSGYLPYVKFTGTDDHLLPVPPLHITEDGNGRGVQAEVLLSYMFTPQFSVGAGWRYWAMWTTSGSDAFNGVPVPRNDTHRVERSGLLLQASYKFEPPAAVVAKY